MRRDRADLLAAGGEMSWDEKHYRSQKPPAAPLLVAILLPWLLWLFVAAFEGAVAK